MDWISLISGYPVWARVVVIICVLIAGGVLILARKVEEPKQANVRSAREGQYQPRKPAERGNDQQHIPRFVLAAISSPR